MTIFKMSTEALEAIVEALDGIDDDEAGNLVFKIERELDARAAAESDDERIRESVGVYV